MSIAQLETLHIIWLAHLAAYRSRMENLAVFFELEAFEERLERYRRKGV